MIPTRTLLGALLLGLAACGAPASQHGGAALPELALEPLADGVWMHTSYRALPDYGLIGANGLVIATRDGALLVDTAWGEAQTLELLERVQGEIGPVRAVIVTHHHDDRASGLAALHARGVASYGSRRTAEHLRAQGAAAPEQLFSSHLPLEQLGVDGEVFFPGRGHTDDNVVVWLRRPRLLFGGCLVKSADAEDLGNTADADLDAWPRSVEQLWGRYQDVEIVVPGHGRPGTRTLLAHTRALLKPTPQ